MKDALLKLSSSLLQSEPSNKKLRSKSKRKSKKIRL